MEDWWRESSRFEVDEWLMEAVTILVFFTAFAALWLFFALHPLTHVSRVEQSRFLQVVAVVSREALRRRSDKNALLSSWKLRMNAQQRKSLVHRPSKVMSCTPQPDSNALFDLRNHLLRPTNTLTPTIALYSHKPPWGDELHTTMKLET